jgi:tRNA ligase
LHKHLEKAGKTTEQLAAALKEKNWTAIAEVRPISVIFRPLLSDLG